MKSLESRPTHPSYNVLTNTPSPLPKFLTVEMRTPAVPSSLLFDYIPGDLLLHDSQTISVLLIHFYELADSLLYSQSSERRKSKLLDYKGPIQSHFLLARRGSFLVKTDIKLLIFM